jgi:hypothetical protein
MNGVGCKTDAPKRSVFGLIWRSYVWTLAVFPGSLD